jgi:hypothetical protein
MAVHVRTGQDPIGRTRAVYVAGAIDFSVGLAVSLVGLGLVVQRGNRDSLPLGLAMTIGGLLLALTGLGRMTARMTVTSSHVTWTWWFAKHEVSLQDLEEAALVEKGSPAPGAAWAGFLGGGFAAVLAWWLLDVVVAFISSEPSLGSFDLVLIKHHGEPIQVRPISAWSTRSSHSQANEALRAVQIAIASSWNHAPQHPQILLRDSWDSLPES